MEEDQEATREGVSDSVTDRRAAIYKAADALRAEDLVPMDQVVPYEADAPEDTDAEESVQKDEAPVQEPEREEVEEPQPTEPSYKLRVDGVEQEWPLSRILAQAQKATAVEKRLEEAALLKRQLEEERARIAQLSTPKPEPKPIPLSELPLETIKGRLADVDRRLWTEATTEEDIRTLQAQRAELEEAWMDRKLAEREKYHEERQKASEEEKAQKAFIEEVKKVHPDLDDITVLKDETGRVVSLKPDFEAWLDNQPTYVRWGYMNSPDPIDPIKILMQYKQERSPVSPSLAETRDRKKSIEVVPSGSARHKPPEEPKPMSNSEYVTHLRKQRSSLGQDYET